MKIEMQLSGIDDFILFQETIGSILQKILPHSHILMEVALNEAVNNALKHGIQENSKNLVFLKISMNQKRLIIRVKHTGTGFPGNQKLAQIKQGKYKHNLSADSGRGLFMMCQIADEIKYNKKGNEILIVKNRV